MTIRDKLIHLRKEYDLTQKELGKIAGVSGAAVSAWELGDRSPKIGPLGNICKHFGIDIYSFVDESLDDYQMILPTNVTPMEKTKKSPSVAETTPGEDELDMLDKLLDMLISIGLIRKGEDVTARQAEVLTAVCRILNATFQ